MEQTSNHLRAQYRTLLLCCTVLVLRNSTGAVGTGDLPASPLAPAHTLFQQGRYAEARQSYETVVNDASQPKVIRSFSRFCIADTYVKQKEWASARRVLEDIRQTADLPEHLRWEAAERLKRLDRIRNGLPPRDPMAHRTTLPPLPKASLTLHVSPGGNDANPGTRQQPFATLERARDELRSRRQKGSLPRGTIAVEIHGGDHEVTRTFTLHQEDSGTADSPIIYRAAPGETPRFRGGQRLTHIGPVAHPAALKRLPESVRGRVREINLRADGIDALLPLKLGGFASGHGFKTHPAHELFYNGQALTMACWPNTGFIHIKDVAVKDGTKGYDREGSKIGRFFYSDERPARWVDEPDLLLYGYWFWDWADSYERVETIDPERKLITLRKPYHRYGYSINAPFKAVHALCELDAPGEWYLDRANLRAYFLPPNKREARPHPTPLPRGDGAPGAGEGIREATGSSPGPFGEAARSDDSPKATLELSLFAHPMLQLDNVSHVRFEGLTWELGSADAIKIRGGEQVILAGCTIRHFAGNAVEINGGSKHGLLSCDIYSLGRGGVTLNGGDRKTLQPGGHFVENCDIHDLSRIDHTYTPAIIISGVGNRATHNRLHDIGSSALRVGGNDHLIELNEVFHVVLESDDQGGADMYGNPTYRGNVYRYNYWHHIGSLYGPLKEHPRLGQAGVRLDDAICGTLIYGNIFDHCSTGKRGFGAIQIHGGKENIIDNNLFIGGLSAFSFTPWPEQKWKERTKNALAARDIDRDLYVKRYPLLAHLDANLNLNHLWRNIAVGPDKFFRQGARGNESVENVFLANAEATLPSALSLLEQPGMAPIPFKEIGLYQDRHRTSLP